MCFFGIQVTRAASKRASERGEWCSASSRITVSQVDSSVASKDAGRAAGSTELYILWSELRRRKLSPQGHYSQTKPKPPV